MLKYRIRNLAVAATMIVAVTGLTVFTAGGSSAADISTWTSSTAVTLPSCPAHTLCTFQNAGYGGQRWNFDYNSEPHATWFWVGSANDQISSFYNARAWTSYFAKNCPADNQWAVAAGGVAVPNLNDGHHTWPDGTNANDSISAIALGTNTGVSYPAHGSC